MKTTLLNQLSLVIPNEPGQMARLCKVLAERKINVGSLMFLDSTSQGVVRLTVEDAPRAQKILEEEGYFVAVAQVVAVDVPNRAGALYTLSKALADAGINIEYAYASDHPGAPFIRDTFKLSDLEKGVKIIEQLPESNL